jgi:hypothetical protein
VTPGGRVARPRWWPGVAAWALWALAMLGLATVPWFDHLLRQAGRSDLVQSNADAVPFVLAILSAATVGAVLAGRRPHHPVGWLLLTLGLSLSGTALAAGYAAYGLLARPGALPAAPRWSHSPQTEPVRTLPRPRTSTLGIGRRSTAVWSERCRAISESRAWLGPPCSGCPVSETWRHPG